MAIQLVIDTPGGANFGGYNLRNVSTLHVGGADLAAPGYVGQFSGRVLLKGITHEEVITFTDGDTTPRVSDGDIFQTANTTATVITDFDGGYNGQRITVKLDANTTVQHNDSIILSVGTDISAAANKLITLVRYNGVWIQEGFASSIATGGQGGGGTTGTTFWQDWSLVTVGRHGPDVARFTSYNDPDEDYELVVRSEVDGIGGKTLKNEGSGGASRSWVFTQVPPSAAVDILVKCRSQSAPSYNSGMGTMCRMSVESNGFNVNGWGCRLWNANPVGTTREFGMWKYVDNAVHIGASVSAPTWADDTWMFIRMRADSLSIKARHWAEGYTEPTTWDVESEHDVAITTGWVGLYADEPATAEEFDFISVEINGGIAPSTGTPVVITVPDPTISSPTYGPFDFENDTLGIIPAGWTERFNTAGVDWPVFDDSGNYIINSVKTSGGVAYLDLDAMSDATTTQEILAKVRQSSLPTNGSGVALRTTNGGSGYAAAINNQSISIEEFLNGVYVTTHGTTSVINQASEWYWIRFRADDTLDPGVANLTVKVWRDDEPEPKAWMHRRLDTTLAAGSAALYHFPNNTTHYDDVSIAA